MASMTKLEIIAQIDRIISELHDTKRQIKATKDNPEGLHDIDDFVSAIADDLERDAKFLGQLESRPG